MDPGQFGKGVTSASFNDTPFNLEIPPAHCTVDMVQGSYFKHQAPAIIPLIIQPAPSGRVLVLSVI